LRSDNLSAATHELKLTGGRTLTVRFRGVLDHYDLRSTRIQPGESHENGVVEQRHYRTKSALAQALLLRAAQTSRSEADYRGFVARVVANRIATCKARSTRRRSTCVRCLPRQCRATPPSVESAQWSTIRVGKKTYSCRRDWSATSRGATPP